MFVTMDKLSDPQGSNVNTNSVNKTVEPHPSHPSQAQDGPLQLGDVVTFFNENDKPINAVVRWIGRNRSILKNGSAIVIVKSLPSVLY